MSSKDSKFFLADFIDILNDKVLKGISKMGRLISNKKSHDVMEMFSKILVMFILILLIRIPIYLLGELGTYIIYSIGTIFRGFLSSIWKFVLNYSYYFISLMLVYYIFKDMYENKELNIIEMDRKEDKKVKKSFFVPIIKFIRIIAIISEIPLLFIIGILFFVIGMNGALAANGSYLVSIFIIAFGLVISIVYILYIINDYLFNEKFIFFKKISKVFFGLCIFLFGILSLMFETINYNYIDVVPDYFVNRVDETIIDIDANKEYKIIKGKNNKNIIINKVVDSSLTDRIIISTDTLETSSLQSIVKNDENLTTLTYYNTLNLDLIDILNLYNSTIDIFVNRSIYNLNRLKYSTITIYGSQENLQRIQIEEK